MNLKRIIKEEMDDMDWIKDIDTPQVGDTYKFIMSGQFNGKYKSNPWNIVITDIKEHPSRQVGYSVITLHYRLQNTTVKYMPILKDYEIYLDEFLTGVEEGRFVKIKEINESDDLQWIRDVRPIKYNIGDVINPINGYFYYTKPWSEKYGPISGHVNAKIIDIVDEFYEIVLNYDIYEDILEAPIYYISIYDTDNKNLNESDDLQWMKEIPNTIIVGSCIKSSKGVDWRIEHIHIPTNTVIVKSRYGHRQSWDLTALYIQNRKGKLKLCTGETIPQNSIPVPHQLRESDLQWIEDVNDDPLSMNDSWILINDVDHNDIGEGIKMQQFLFNKGYKWFSDEIMPNTTKQKSYKIYAITHIIKDVEGVVRHSLINYWPSSLRDVYPKDYLEDKQGSFKGDKIIYWSEIKG